MIRVSIKPQPLTPDSLPAEGEVIGYTGRAYYGEDFATRGYISGAIRIGERTYSRYGAGFYAEMMPAEFAPGGDEIYVMWDDEGRQLLHGFVLPENEVAA